jgi:hypothetical protein
MRKSLGGRGGGIPCSGGGEQHEKCQSVHSTVRFIPATYGRDVDLENRAGATCSEFYKYIFLIIKY